MVGAEKLLRDYLTAGDHADYARMHRLLAADVVCRSPGDVVLRGVDALINSWAVAHEGLANLDHRVLAVVGGSGSAVAARLRASGTHLGPFLGVPPTGSRVEVDQALFVRTTAFRIAEMWEIVDTGHGLRQLGVLAQQPLAPGAPPTS